VFHLLRQLQNADYRVPKLASVELADLKRMYQFCA